MKKNKTPIIITDEDEKFYIPQIDYGTTGLIKKKSGFQKSKVCSPFHGTNVLDKVRVVDNKGSIDVDNYDYIRSDDEKHLTEEDLIKKYGSKYHEFSILNHNDKEAYIGTDYDKKEEDVKKEVRKTTFSFIEDLLDDEEEVITPVIENEPEEDIKNPDNEFKLDISIDDDVPAYEYNTYDKKMPKPEQTNIPSFLTEKNNYQEDKKANDFKFDIDEDLSFDATPTFKSPKIEFDSKEEYSNPAVDRNQTIEEAIMKMQNQTNNEIYKQTENPNPIKNNPSPNIEDEYYTKPNKSKYEDYFIPYRSIFKTSTGTVDEHPAWLEEKKEVINQTLKNFGIDGEVVTYTKGPAFTRYEILLAPGVNVKKVSQNSDNLQMSLQAKSIRIQAPIPGKNTVGIEVPNDVSEVVAFGDIINEEYVHDNKPLNVAMGKNIDGTPVYQNIIDMPHALIAGATKSGKSVSINTILVSLLIKNSPDRLKLILVDPKKVELSFYNDLPHLATPVIDDAAMATQALKWAVDEMERRYDILARTRVRNIDDYNKKKLLKPELENMPFIVIVVDEFNDLVMQCGAEANEAIIRLAQKARACGIHIILATQRPTVDVVNGTIKANITCRIAFRVASDMDSRTILDENGAESLLGRGDMLIKNNSTPIRAQGAYISDDEIGAVCDYICERYEPDFLFTHDDLKRALNKTQGGGNNSKADVSESEELLYQIAEACVQQGTCSINSIQQGFGLGFNRAQRIVQILEERQIVSPKNGTKQREILVDSYKLRQIFGIDDNL